MAYSMPRSASSIDWRAGRRIAEPLEKQRDPTHGRQPGLSVAILAFAARVLRPTSIFMACAGIAFVTQNVTSNMIIQMLAPDELRGRVISVYVLFFFGTTPVGAMFAAHWPNGGTPPRRSCWVRA